MDFIHLFYFGLFLAIVGTIGALYTALDDENTLGSIAPKRLIAASGTSIMASVLWWAPWPDIDPVGLWGWRFTLSLITVALILPEIRKVFKYLVDHSYPVG